MQGQFSYEFAHALQETCTRGHARFASAWLCTGLKGPLHVSSVAVRRGHCLSTNRLVLIGLCVFVEALCRQTGRGRFQQQLQLQQPVHSQTETAPHWLRLRVHACHVSTFQSSQCHCAMVTIPIQQLWVFKADQGQFPPKEDKR